MAENRWGAGGKPRPGATDTTMLIWKVIDANPGITADQLFEKIEHQIPSGYALRTYAAKVRANSQRDRRRTRGGDADRVASPPLTTAGLDPRRARWFVQRSVLSRLIKTGVVGTDDGGYRIRRPIKRYRGNPDHIDETGTKAGRHLNAAYAYRDAQKAIKRVNPANPRPTAAEWQSITKAVESLHAYLVDAS